MNINSRLKADKIKRRLEEEEFMTLRPIMDSSNDPVVGDSAQQKQKQKLKPETDTTNANGFIAKLGRKEQERAFDDSGILSPEEGAQLFGEFGVRGLTGNKEEREFMESMKRGGKGSGSSSSGGGGNSNSNGSSNDNSRTMDQQSVMDSLLGGASIRGVVDGTTGSSSSSSSSGNGGNRGGQDDELMADLMRQMGSDGAKDLGAIPDVKSVFGANSDSPPPPPPPPPKKQKKQKKQQEGGSKHAAAPAAAAATIPTAPAPTPTTTTSSDGEARQQAMLLSEQDAADLYVFCYTIVLPPFLVCERCLCLSLSIYYCLSAFSDTTWHESNHHPLPPSINHQLTILALLIITIQAETHRQHV
jgi:hypothetical protein